MIDLISYNKALGSIYDKKYSGSFIGKVKYEKFISKESKDINYKAKEIKCNKWLSIIEIECLSNGILLEKMIVTIVLKPLEKSNDINKKIYINNSYVNVNKNYYPEFSKKDIYDFSNMVADKNPIHLKENAIVQGMLIINELINKYSISSDFIIKFLNPIYEKNKVYLSEYDEDNKKVIEGISKNFKYFKLFMEE